MFDSYKIAVRLKLEDALSVPLAMVTRHLRGAEEAAGKLQSRMASMRAFFAGGMGLIGAGATIAAPLLYAVDKAAQFQKQMIAVQIATRGTTEQLTAMRAVIEGVSGQTIFSALDVAKMAKQIATGTGLSAPGVQSVLPAYVKYADVQSLLKDTPYTTSIADAIRAAHGAQHYDAASLTSYLNLLNKASLFIPGSTSEIVRALAYSQSVSKQVLGTSDEDNVLMVALLNRLGLSGTRGGTNLIAAMTRTIPGIFGSGLLTGKSNVALHDMGMVDTAGHSKVFKDGKFDPITWMGLMADYVGREFASHPEAIARQDIMKNIQRAAGSQGGKVDALLANPQAIDMWRQMSEQFAQYGGFESMQKTFADNSVWQQWQNSKTDFQNAMMELGNTLLPLITPQLKKLNIYLNELADWMRANPDKVRQYAKDIAYFAASLVGLGIVSVTTSAIIGLSTVVRGLAGAASAATSATTGFAGALAKITRVGAAAGLGYAVGTIAYDNFIDGTSFGDWLGKKEAQLLAHFGNQTAADALAAGGPDTAPHGLIDRGPPSLTNFSQSIAPPTSPLLSTTNVTNVYLDGKLVKTVVDKHISKTLSGPQTGPSLFDGSLMSMPAGGGGP